MLWALFSATFAIEKSHASAVTLLGGITFANHEPRLGSSKMSYLAGFLTEFTLGQSPLALETGAFYLMRRREPVTLSIEEYFLHAPLGLRFFLGPVMSIYAGGYFAVNPRSQNKDFGMTYALAWSLPLLGKAIFTTEIRYLMGMKELTAPAGGEVRDLYLWLGLRLPIKR